MPNQINYTPWTLKLKNGDEIIGGLLDNNDTYVRLAFPTYFVNIRGSIEFTSYINTNREIWVDIKKDKINIIRQTLYGFAVRYQHDWINSMVLGNFVSLSDIDYKGYTNVKAWNIDYEDPEAYGTVIHSIETRRRWLNMNLKSLKLIGGEELITHNYSFNSDTGKHICDYPSYIAVSPEGINMGTYVDSVSGVGLEIDNSLVVSVFDTDLAYADGYEKHVEVQKAAGY